MEFLSFVDSGDDEKLLPTLLQKRSIVMRLQKVLNILGQMPKKSQKVVMAVVDFDKMTPSENFTKIIDAMIAIETSKSAFISNSVTNPSIHSLNIGIPQSMVDIQEIESRDRIKLVIKLIIEIVINVMSIIWFFVNLILNTPLYKYTP